MQSLTRYGQFVEVQQDDGVDEGHEFASERDKWVESLGGDSKDIHRLVVGVGVLTEHPGVTKQSKEAFVEEGRPGSDQFHLGSAEFATRVDGVLVYELVT